MNVCDHIHTRQQLEEHWKKGCGDSSIYCALCQVHDRSCDNLKNIFLHLCDHPPPPQDKFVLTSKLRREVATYLQMEILEQIRGFQSDFMMKEKELQDIQPASTYKDSEGLMWMAQEVRKMIHEALSSS